MSMAKNIPVEREYRSRAVADASPWPRKLQNRYVDTTIWNDLQFRSNDVVIALVVRHPSFDHMKANAARYAPHNGRVWQGGAQTFIHKGSNGRWREVLTAEERHSYELVAEERLGKPCARCLAAGRLAE